MRMCREGRLCTFRRRLVAVLRRGRVGALLVYCNLFRCLHGFFIVAITRSLGRGTINWLSVFSKGNYGPCVLQ